MTDHLDFLESHAMSVIREAYRRIKPVGMLW
ncbi:MAG: sulfate adenylyltransferase, partial [Candidatus Eremiobacteraeota bacterium]|nr:sulfate adenylyltransferase [Candidatus Eremiobacteraeota bacterium]